jgi:hypothetical protein
MSLGITYTLAYRFGFRTIESEVRDEIKKHDLDSLTNVWICLLVPNELLEELDAEEQKRQFLEQFVRSQPWLDGLLLFNIVRGSSTELDFSALTASME